MAASQTALPDKFIRCSTLACKAEGYGRRFMTFASLLALIPALFGLAGAGTLGTQMTVSRVVVQDEVILRIPVQPMPRQLDWVEHKGPKCLHTGEIRGARLSGPEQVDFLLRDRSRVRAQFEHDCPALDFYQGFYINSQDERLCAKRDSVHSRMGGSCRIERFRSLKPKAR